MQSKQKEQKHLPPSMGDRGTPLLTRKTLRQGRAGHRMSDGREEREEQEKRREWERERRRPDDERIPHDDEWTPERQDS